MIYANEMTAGQFPCKCAVIVGSRPFINHCHPELEMIKIRKGRMKISSEGESLVLNEGEIWMAPPFASHSIDGGSWDSVHLAILMEPRLMGLGEEYGKEWKDPQRTLEQARLYSMDWPLETKAHVDAVMEDIYREYSKKEYGWQLALKTLADQLLLWVVRGMPRCETKHLNTQVRKLKDILEYIALHYCGSISLLDCAQVAGFNPTYFSRYFSKHMGITFQEYVKKLRIDKARWLLQSDGGSVTEVCYQCGYRDIKTFNKLFGQETGMSPTRFRKEAKGI